jgi:hypothetical protein
LVERSASGHLVPRREDATIDDLKRACEAVGLVCFEAGQQSALVADAEARAEAWRCAFLGERDKHLPPTEGRATDEELLAIHAAHTGEGSLSNTATMLRAVAARVRRERGECLVERLVAKGCYFQAFRRPAGTWDVVCQESGKLDQRDTCPAADVPNTLARLAGLDGGK